MKNIIVVIQIILSFMLIGSILLQARGSGLGSAWGGSGQSYHTKRGIEKTLFYATIVFSALFLLFAIINIMIG